MNLNSLKRAVCQANLDLVKEGLVLQTWGNASGVDRAQGVLVIKPSGVPYAGMKPGHMVVVPLAGQGRKSPYKPSTDVATHLALYRAFKSIGGIVHTHSLYATAWAQAKKPIPCLGTTHADHWFGEVPCTRALTPREIKSDYEAATGRVIIERFKDLDPLQQPAVLVPGHGPFTWGKTVADAVHHAAVLEFVARLASETLRLEPGAEPIGSHLLNKHFLRKHGPDKYYGQH